MAARVVDGLFVGDALSSMDVNFLVANKITRVINCAALELENRWEALGIEYLSFEWVAEENFDLLAADGMTQAWGQDANEFEVEGCPCVWLGKTCAFIEEALEVGAGVLVHSQDGTNRACSCVLAYLMNVYGWSLHKSMSFLQRKRSDLLPSQKFVKQLQQVSDWLETTYLDAIPHAADWAARKFRSWNVADIDLHMISTRANEELLLHNTYLNSDASESQPHAVWAKAGHDAGNLHPNESSRTTEMPLLFDQQKTLAPVTVSSPHRAKRKSRREAGLACREPKSVSWIDADEIVRSGQPVMRSPFSKRVVPERPPGPSYRSLAATGQWMELESSPAADSRRSPSKAAMSSLSPARTGPSPVNFASIVYEESEITREEEEEEELGLRLKPRATRPIPEPPGMAESLSSEPEASSMAESLLSVREDHANPADEDHFENTAHASDTANRSGASTNLPLMLDNLNLGHLRSALMAKGVVESGSVHAHRPPSPPVSPPRRRTKRASKPAQRPSTSLTRPTSASASRTREMTRAASKFTAKSKRLSSSTKTVRSLKKVSSQKMKSKAPTSSRREQLGSENVEPPPMLSKSCPPRRPARAARNRGKARALSQDDHHNLTTTLAVDTAQLKVSSRR